MERSVARELAFLPVDEAVKAPPKEWWDPTDLIDYADEPDVPRPLFEWLKDVDYMKAHGSPVEQEAARKVDLYEWLLAWRAAGRPTYA